MGKNVIYMQPIATRLNSNFQILIVHLQDAPIYIPKDGFDIVKIVRGVGELCFLRDKCHFKVIINTQNKIKFSKPYSASS